jgi:hypothetical protein
MVFEHENLVSVFFLIRYTPYGSLNGRQDENDRAAFSGKPGKERPD